MDRGVPPWGASRLLRLATLVACVTFLVWLIAELLVGSYIVAGLAWLGLSIASGALWATRTVQYGSRDASARPADAKRSQAERQSGTGGDRLAAGQLVFQLLAPVAAIALAISFRVYGASTDPDAGIPIFLALVALAAASGGPRIGWLTALIVAAAFAILTADRPTATLPLVALGAAAIALAVGTVTSQSKRAHDALVIANLRLHRLALRDVTTGLLNADGFKAALRAAIARERRGKRGLALLVFVLSDVAPAFSARRTGAAFQVFADSIEQHIRESDMAGRIGSQTFAIIATETDREGAAFIGERIMSAYRRTFHGLAMHAVPPDVTCRIATFPDDGDAADELLATTASDERAGPNIGTGMTPSEDSGSAR